MERQSYTNSLEYFIEKNGGDKEKGEKQWKKLNEQKSLSFDNLMRKYNDKKKVLKMLEKHYNSLNTYSMISQNLFNKIYVLLPDDLKSHTYFATLNKEFGKFDNIDKRYYWYDFVISNIKFCIEFNGDHYHANPSIYLPNEIPIVYPIKEKHIAKNIWDFDNKKIKLLNNLDFDVIIVWESDYKKNKKLTVEKCLRKIHERIEFYKKL